MTYQITLKKSQETEGEDVTITCDSDEYILDAAENVEEVDLPYSCRSGACSSCVGRIESGTVDQSEQTFLDDDQIASGYALLCVARPTSNCVIHIEVEGDL